MSCSTISFRIDYIRSGGPDAINSSWGIPSLFERAISALSERRYKRPRLVITNLSSLSHGPVTFAIRFVSVRDKKVMTVCWFQFNCALYCF